MTLGAGPDLGFNLPLRARRETKGEESVMKTCWKPRSAKR